MVKRFEIWLVSIDASDTNTRPAVIISPNELNRHLEYSLVAPITSDARDYPTRIPFELFGSVRFIAIDQIQTVEKARFTKRFGELNEDVEIVLLERLEELFAK
jgi:mRNA interferase MazF